MRRGRDGGRREPGEGVWFVHSGPPSPQRGGGIEGEGVVGKLLLIGLIALLGLFGLSTRSYAAGLTVKPAALRVAVPWGETAQTQLLVSNTTDAPGMYQAAVEPAAAGTAAPDGFRLAPGESQLLTVNVRGRLRLGSATVAVAALPLDQRGVAVGSGVKVPLDVQVLMPWWLVGLGWALPLLAIGWWWVRRRRAGSLQPWAAATLAAIGIASVGLVGLLAVADWPVRQAGVLPRVTATNTVQTYRLTVDFGGGRRQTWEYPAGVESANAFALTQRVARQQGIELAVRDYGSLGVLLTGIGDVRNDIRAKTYWYLWVNGQFARTSASGITLVPGDHVEWRYVSEMKPE